MRRTGSQKRPMPAKLLIIEDSPPMLHMYQGFLQKEPFQLLKAETGKAGLRILRDQRPELLLLDLQLPDIDGQQILELIAAEQLGTTTIVMTAHGSINVAVDAMRLGANDFLVKPFAQERLVQSLHNAVELRQLKTKVAVYQQLDRPSYDEMIGSSLAMQAVYRTIDSAAPSDATVLITGETGTGKELVAQALHRASPRRDGNITVLNCAAIPKDLIESELFGHVKGAFTGATTDRDGAAQMAHNGTLFLDEIGEMDIGLQSKLLRFLQSGSFQRVGSSRLEHSNARIICATNRDAWADVQAGRFREDLYYRLNVIPIVLPALRERGGDVLEIARECLRRFSKRDGKAFQDFDEQVQNLLMSYSWPGNIRQLQNVVRNIVVLHNAPLVTLNMMPPLEQVGLPQSYMQPMSLGGGIVPPVNAAGLPQSSAILQPSPMPVATPTTAAPISEDELRPMWIIEQEMIDKALEFTGGNVNKAASLLEISPSSVYRKRTGK
ncbi:MAG: sigma-54-dependent Fis family transcriptional regulator [Alphaproteobacteria bacterium TMED89]|nr:sigma-54-dependent Fis family transcriptional regulator [Rhodospirillaceae bacterium]RPH13226.1 MAG: sigma-54-dependent Fis family transcriptional regulator [Alphaproteobacteria bacterium TMED89]